MARACKTKINNYNQCTRTRSFLCSTCAFYSDNTAFMESKSRNGKILKLLCIHYYIYRYSRLNRKGHHRGSYQTVGTNSIPGDKGSHDGNADTNAERQGGETQGLRRVQTQKEAIPKGDSPNGYLRTPRRHNPLSTGCSAASALVWLHG